MKRRSSGSTDDGDESLVESDLPDPDREIDSKARSIINPRPSPTRSRRPSSLNWKQINGCNGHVNEETLASAALTKSSLAAATSNMALARVPSSPPPRGRTRGVSVSILALLTTTLGIALLFTILRSLVTRQLDPKGCRMSYMRPSYVHFSDFDTEHTRFATKYSLYLYREQGIDDEHKVSSFTRHVGCYSWTPVKLTIAPS